jgi:hypothetical protein
MALPPTRVHHQRVIALAKTATKYGNSFDISSLFFGDQQFSLRDKAIEIASLRSQ